MDGPRPATPWDPDVPERPRGSGAPERASGGARPSAARGLLPAAALAGVVAALVAVAAHATGASGEAAWFPATDPPAWVPPADVAATAWLVFPFVVAAAAVLVWHAGGPRAWGSLALCALLLGVHVLWPVPLEGFSRPFAALAGNLAVLVASVGAASAGARWSRPSAWLLGACCTWQAVATVVAAAAFGLAA